MNRMSCKFYAFILIAACFACSCNNKRQPGAVSFKGDRRIASMPVKYARGFTVSYFKDCKLITVRDWKDTTKILAQYVLLDAGKELPDMFRDEAVIRQPVHKVVCISTPHITIMHRLNLLDSIAGITNVSLIYDTTVTNKVKQGRIANLGNDELNYERLVELAPSFVIVSGSFDGGDKMRLKLTTLHVRSILDLDYMEQDPLGRAEWIKFIAAFYNKEDLADSIFSGIERNYLALREKGRSFANQPTVFCNIPFKEIWYMPCGDNYVAKIIEDAGGNFLWKDAKATNGFNLSLDYEAVYNKAANADIWINPGFANSLAEIKAADKKNTLFKAYKTGMVFNNNRRNTPNGGFDFWESGIINPDKILADLIFILHPDALPGYQLYYYQQLK